MSEEPTTPAEAGETGPVAGERLAEARRARGVSLDEIARELHLDGTKVRALEQNDFARLGAPVFIKGYLRKYASLVGLSGEAVLADYERLNPSAAAPPIIGLRTHPKPGASPVPWLVTVAVVGVVAVGAWWWFAEGPAVTDRGTRTVDPAPVETSGTEAAEERPALEVVDESEPLTTAPVGELEVGETAPPQVPAADQEAPEVAAAAREEEQVVDAAPAAGHVALELSFSGDCWTEVTDANGERLYFGLGTEGRTVAVEGEPPLQVLVGDSENVRVTVAGSPYTIPRSARRGDTARFTITP